MKLLLLSLFLTALSTNSYTKYNIFHSPGDVDSYLENQTLTCEDKNGCKKGISKVISLFEYEGSALIATRCTGTLLENGILTTAAHCVPSDLKDNDSCEGRMFFKIYQQDGKVADVGCDKIIEISEISEDNMDYPSDYAFIKVKETEQNIETDYQFGKSSFPNNKLFDVTTISHDKFDSKISNHQCLTVMGNYIYPLYVNENNPRVLLADCRFEPGVSGSPIILGNKVIGVIDNSTETKGFDDLKKVWEEDGLLLDGEISPQSIGTSFQCVQYPKETPYPLSNECYEGFGRAGIDKLRSNMIYRNESVKKMKEDLIEEVNAHEDFFSSDYRWSLSSFHNFARFHALQMKLPECYNKGLEKKLKKDRQKVVIKMDKAPYWEVNIGFTKYNHFIAKEPIRKYTEGTLEFIGVYNKEDGEISFTLKQSIIDMEEEYTLDIESCESFDD